MIAVVALAFTSCKKNKDQEQVGIRITGSTEAFVVDASEDRAYINPNDGKSTDFEKDDQIMVYNVNIEEPNKTNYGIYWTTEPGHDVTWKYSSGTVINHNNLEDLFLAFYPAEIVNNGNLWHGNNEALFEIVNHQNYRKVNGNVLVPKGTLAMAAQEEVANIVDEIHVQFRNIMGVMEINMKSASSKTVESIVYEDNMFNVTGRVHLKLHEVNSDELLWLCNNYDPSNTTYAARLANYITTSGYFVDDAYVAMKGKTITLNCGEGVQLNPNTPEKFVITLRPLAAYAGYKLTVNFTDGSHSELSTTLGGLDRMIKPNYKKPVNINNVDAYLQ
jgi:hypothetical protein